MRRPRGTLPLSSLTLAVALVALNFAIVRWGLHLPNLMANDLIQPMVVGSAPTVSLLVGGLVLAIRDRMSQGRCRPFWLGFLAFGAIGLVAYLVHAYLLCRPGRHYSTDYEMAIRAALLRCGLPRSSGNPSTEAVRYSAVVASLVFLLALPQILFAVLGGWLAERMRSRLQGVDSCLRIPPA